jgi:hypothetical protein
LAYKVPLAKEKYAENEASSRDRVCDEQNMCRKPSLKPPGTCCEYLEKPHQKNRRLKLDVYGKASLQSFAEASGRNFACEKLQMWMYQPSSLIALPSLAYNHLPHFEIH